MGLAFWIGVCSSLQKKNLIFYGTLSCFLGRDMEQNQCILKEQISKIFVLAFHYNRIVYIRGIFQEGCIIKYFLKLQFNS